MTTDDNGALANWQPSPERQGFDAVEIELAKLLARGISYGESAQILGLSKSTVARRMADPTYRALVNRQRAIGVDDFLAGQIAGAEAALAFLQQVVADDTQPDLLRVKAASTLLGGLSRWQRHAAFPTGAVTADEARAALVRHFVALRATLGDGGR